LVEPYLEEPQFPAGKEVSKEIHTLWF
jgi:hypothetical protein